VLLYLTRTLPETCAEWGDQRLREEIGYGLTRAADYGITSERDTARYLELALLLGRDFDTSPTLPWARPILLDRASSAENRLRRLRVMAHQRVQASGALQPRVETRP
jgi:hypothetical protein